MPRKETIVKSTTDLTERDVAVWRVVGATGAALLAVGALDLLLAVLPLRIGNPEWEFATISALLNGFPVPALGAALLLASGLMLDSLSVIVTAATWSIFVGLTLLAAGVLYLLDIPLALKAVTETAAREALKSAMLKTLASFMAYLSIHIYFVIHCARFLRSQ